MSARDDNHAELEAETLRDMIMRITGAEHSAIIAADQRATSSLCNSLLDRMANTPALTELVRTALSSPSIFVGVAFQRLVHAVMKGDAEVQALRALAEQYAQAAADPEQCKPRSTADAAALDQLRGGP